jgi:hypothetical protein
LTQRRRWKRSPARGREWTTTRPAIAAQTRDAVRLKSRAAASAETL